MAFPNPDPSVSFWLAQNKASSLITLRSTEHLPEEADVVIIGSGLSGSATAYWLLKGSAKPLTVLLLEARDVCSGATARNGGHCRPDPYREYSTYKRLFGKVEAKKLIQNEIDTLDLVEAIIKEEHIDCAFWRGKSLDVACTNETLERWASSLAEFRKDGGNVDGVEWIGDPVQAKEISRMPKALAVAIFSAGSFSAYRYTGGLLKIAIKAGLNVQSFTPVTSIETAQDGQSSLVRTLRGEVRASKVVFATEAFTGTLLPEFKGLIAPYREQCSQIIPTRNYSGPHCLKYTICPEWSEEVFDYIIQRPLDGSIILGGGRSAVAVQERIGQHDDSVLSPETEAYFQTAMAKHFADWGTEAPGEGLSRTWSGIQGFTHDAIPYVGALSKRPNSFILAGNHGHGMARITTCARGLAHLILTGEWDERVPLAYQPSETRMYRDRPTVEEVWLEGSK